MLPSQLNTVLILINTVFNIPVFRMLSIIHCEMSFYKISLVKPFILRHLRQNICVRYENCWMLLEVMVYCHQNSSRWCLNPFCKSYLNFCCRCCWDLTYTLSLRPVKHRLFKWNFNQYLQRLQNLPNFMYWILYQWVTYRKR